VFSENITDLLYKRVLHLYQMSAIEIAAALPSAEKVVAAMISRSAVLFRLPESVLRDMERHWAVMVPATGGARPSRRVERRCAMKRTRAKVSYKPLIVCVWLVKNTVRVHCTNCCLWCTMESIDWSLDRPF